VHFCNFVSTAPKIDDELYNVLPAGRENACSSFIVSDFILQDFHGTEQCFIGYKVLTAVTTKNTILLGCDAT
jgi:hypothetical protein